MFVKLESICDIQMGYTAKRGLQAVEVGGVPIIQLRDFADDGTIDPEALMAIQVEDADDRYLVGAGDVLFRSRGTRNTATALGSEFKWKALAVLPVVVLRANRETVLPEYLAWALNQPGAQRYFDTEAQGTSMRMISKSSLASFELALPDLAMQQSVVSASVLAEEERRLMIELSDKRFALATACLAQASKTNMKKALGGKNGN
jgi:hypothetical protein|tara:strand:- start:21766 stop:22377 length:612 start_codon:yes stop_codon:yes gene_type:complete